MEKLRLRSLTFMILIAFVLWSSSFGTCIARQGRQWRHGRPVSSSLMKKKSKSHGSSHHSSGGSSKHQKAPSSSHKAHPAPPSPKPVKNVPPVAPPEKGYAGKKSGPTYSVMDFGAQGDGTTDDTKAFEHAWAAACKVEASTVLVPEEYEFLVGPISFSGPYCQSDITFQAFEHAWAAACKVEASTVLVPEEYEFLVGPISFSGPYCQSDITFQLDGTMYAPTESDVWGRGLLWWIEFSKLKGIMIQGKGKIDGRGSVWWEDSPYDGPIDDETKLIFPLNATVQENPPTVVRSELSSGMPSLKPTALRFYGSFNVTVTGITIQNSPQCHLKFDNCIGVLVHDMSVSSPGDSPNTDGIHLQNSKDVLIRGADLACGDDCISIQTGCSNVYVHNVNCGPGHGISIGSLGRDNTKACVSNITVRDVNMHNTMNGVRIKTWQGGSGSVQGVMFSNIQMSEVQLPIVIDQFYCDKSACKNQSSAVALSGITYERIRGTYTVKPVHLACSDNLPCVDVTLSVIELKPLQERYHLYDPFCWQTFGLLSTPTTPPIGCLQIGKPAKNRPQSDHDYC